jgi:hypothetical protein
LIELYAIPHAERGPHCRISNWRRSVSRWPAKPRRRKAPRWLRARSWFGVRDRTWS